MDPDIGPPAPAIEVGASVRAAPGTASDGRAARREALRDLAAMIGVEVFY